MKEFKSLEKYHINGRGDVYAVMAEADDFDITPRELQGETVLIDGVEYVVKGIDAFAIGLPYPKSLSFGILV